MQIRNRMATNTQANRKSIFWEYRDFVRVVQTPECFDTDEHRLRLMGSAA